MRRRHIHTISIINAGCLCTRCAINDCLGRNAGFPIRAITNFIVVRYSRGVWGGSRDASENLGIERAKTTRAAPESKPSQRRLINRAAFCIVLQLYIAENPFATLH